MFFLCFRLFYIDCSQEFIAHERCKMDDFRAHWWWISVHNWENMYHAKLKLDMKGVRKLFSMWSKVHNDLINFLLFSREQTISFAYIIQFVTIFGYFLPPNFHKYCPSNLQYSEKVVLIQLHTMWKNHNHWSLYGVMTLFQRTIFHEVSIMSFFCKKKRRLFNFPNLQVNFTP